MSDSLGFFYTTSIITDIHSLSQPQAQAQSPPPFQQGGYPLPQAPGPYPTTTYPPQNQGAYPPVAYSQPSFPQQPSPFGRGGGGPPVPYNGFQPQHPGFGHNSVGFNTPLQHQFQQGPPPHIQHPQHPQRHQPPTPSSLPQAHQIPGLPPRPNAPGLPPRPNFTNPGMNNGGFGRGGPVGQAGWNQPPPTHQQQQPAFGGPGTYIPPPSPGQQFGQPQQQQSFSPHNQQGQQFGFPSHGMQQQFGQPQQQQMQHQQQPQHQYQNGNHGRNDSSASLTATGVEGVKMESPDAGTPEIVASMEKKTEKPKRETRMIYGDNEISPVSHIATLPLS